MVQAAIEWRRLTGKVVLFFTVLWLVATVGLAMGAARSAQVPALNIGLALVPGLAFVPAGYFAVRLHATSDRAQIDRIWPMALILGGVGVALSVAVILVADRWGQR